MNIPIRGTLKVLRAGYVVGKSEVGDLVDFTTDKNVTGRLYISKDTVKDLITYERAELFDAPSSNADVAALEAETESLNATNDKLVADLESKDKEIADLKAEIKKLKTALTKAENKKEG